MVLELLGPHCGSRKVDASFDRKTGTRVIAGIPGNLGTGGPDPIRTINKTPLGQQPWAQAHAPGATQKTCANAWACMSTPCSCIETYIIYCKTSVDVNNSHEHIEPI